MFLSLLHTSNIAVQVKSNVKYQTLVKVVCAKMRQIVMVLGLMFGSLWAAGQSTSLKLHELLFSTATLKEWSVFDTALLQAFYKGRQEELFWLDPRNARIRQEMWRLIERAGGFGLNSADYHYQEMQLLQTGSGKLKTIVDSIQADFLFTDGVLRLVSDIRYGRTPALNYNGLKAVPDKQELMQITQKLLEAPNPDTFLASLEPATRPYEAMKALLANFEKVIQSPAFKEERIVSNKIDPSNKPLVLKLWQLGVLDTAGGITDAAIGKAVQEAQRLLDLSPDGKLGPQTRQALNVSIYQRVTVLQKALNDVRWLHRFQTNSIAVINLPSAWLYVYEQEHLKYASRLVVGKKSTPTPTLSSAINEVILYPYWTVPHSIATKELLPHIKRNIGYLSANNFQVLNKQGKVVDPTTINWQGLSVANFPYTIRQSTGCDNSLGIVKFNFDNPFSVYLHDTPAKGLFALQKRYFSHGCMRVEKPLALAELLLQKEKPTVKRLTDQCLRDQRPTIFKLDTPLPVVVLYNTVWYDTQGHVIFYDDIYNK